jgi:mannose-6-phosphate isomerase-like protein (cupin superfamily)
MSRVPPDIRRIVVIDEEGRSRALMNESPPVVWHDDARPGFSSALIWATDHSPVLLGSGIETPPVPRTLEPPPRGSVCRVVTFPPDDTYLATIDAEKVHAFFEAVGSPGASTYSPEAPHPYMQRTETLEFCAVLHGEITLVLDTEEVLLKAGDTVVQRGTNHAWSNRSQEACVVAFSSHDARR